MIIWPGPDYKTLPFLSSVLRIPVRYEISARYSKADRRSDLLALPDTFSVVLSIQEPSFPNTAGTAIT